MRLIDADTIKQRIIAFCTGWRTTYLTVENIVMLINRTDTVDAVPVVRCKDCVAFEQKGKYPAGMPEYPDEMPYGYCYHWDYEEGMSPNQVDGNDFCSYGKRKVDENGRT